MNETKRDKFPIDKSIKCAYLLKDGERTMSEPTYSGSAETVALLLNILMPQNHWSVEFITIEPIPRPPVPAPDLSESDKTFLELARNQK
jgi:hypothetical protein